MTERSEERWRELCRQAIRETDLQRVLELVNEINDLLEARERKNSHSGSCIYGKVNGEV
jgi:hypothetical protein